MQIPSMVRLESLIESVAADHPERLALICGEQRWTYAALRAEMDRRAAMLVEAGLGVGDVVVTNERMTDTLAITFFACCRAGVALLALSPRATAAEVASLSTRAGARAVLTARGERHPMLPLLPALRLDLLGDPPDAALAAAMERSASGTADDVAIMQPTSGTTGSAPKLIPLPHRQLTWLHASPEATDDVSEIYYIPPPNPLYALVLGIGGTVVLSHTIEPEQMEREMTVTGATAIWAVPPVIRLLAEQATPPPAGLRLRVVRTGAMALSANSARQIEARYGVAITTEYGAMETGRLMGTPPGGMPEGSIGTPHPGVEVRLLDEDGRDASEGAVGELIARTPGMVRGYLDDPLATARAFPDGWFRTGDLARRDADGFYYLTGRTTLRINVGGYKVSPEEVEMVLEQHPAVREAVVFAKTDAARGEMVWAVVVPRGEPPTAAELRRFCRARLTGYKVPRGFEFHEELPRSLLGKVVRGAFSS